jgi:hypothetical protein
MINMNPRGLLIDCNDVEQRFSLLLKIMDIYQGYNIFAPTPEEGWRKFSDDVFDRFILLNELTAKQSNQLKHLRRIGFEKRVKNIKLNFGNNVSIIEIDNSSKQSKTTLWTIAASMYLYNECHYIAAPKGIHNREIKKLIKILNGDLCLVEYIMEIHSIATDFLLVMPLWGECNMVSLLLTAKEITLTSIRALPLNKGKIVDYNDEIVFRNPVDGPSLEF